MSKEERKVFIVRGQCGEYSDREEWLVAAFMSRASADDFEAMCTDFARAHGVHRDQPKQPTWNERRVFMDNIKSGALVAPDPSIRADYTGSDYVVLEVPLR